MTPLTWLYVPGDRPERFEKAAASGADVVIVDLEDAVVPAHKAAARENAVQWLASARPGTVEVRVNGLSTPWAPDDLAALADVPALRGVRLPKVESPDDVRAALNLLAAADRDVTCLIETARGVEAAFEIASVPRTGAIALGEADLAGDLGVRSADALTWARSRVLIAARAAGLPAPAMSVFPHVDDLDGLAASSRAGRRLGFVGRAAIHPRQVPVIAAAFRPSPEEIADAHAVIDSFARASEAATGVLVLDDGRMIDPAMVVQARAVLDRAGEPSGSG
ncbi:MAG TPA: CoA ester lyase [Jatrophihabitantaceae bacterium]|nr:CoA ester lyase [Jatrophihabitantaceae bacterium]